MIAIVIAATVATARAGDDPETSQGKAYFDDGSAAFQRGDYAAAARAFAAGYEVEPWSGFLFAWAQAERSAGSCATAIPLYERFLATGPRVEVRAHAIGWIEQCGGKYVEPLPPPPPPPPHREPPPFRYKLAIAFGAAALVSGAIGVRYYIRSREDFAEGAAARRYVDTQIAYDRGIERRTIAQLAGGAGVAFAIAAVVRFAWVARTPVEISVAPQGIAVEGRF